MEALFSTSVYTISGTQKCLKKPKYLRHFETASNDDFLEAFYQNCLK
jgi:hypothetical protein